MQLRYWVEMPPKLKKGSAKKSNVTGATGAAEANKNWESGLTTAPFEEVCYLAEHFLWFNSGLESCVLFYYVAKQKLNV